MAEAEQSFTSEVDASIEDCCAVLLDFDRYPDWSGPTTSSRVLDSYPDGRARRAASRSGWRRSRIGEGHSSCGPFLFKHDPCPKTGSHPRIRSEDRLFEIMLTA